MHNSQIVAKPAHSGNTPDGATLKLLEKITSMPKEDALRSVTHLTVKEFVPILTAKVVALCAE